MGLRELIELKEARENPSNVIKINEQNLRSALEPIGTLNQDDLILLIKQDLKRLGKALSDSEYQKKAPYMIDETIKKLQAIKTMQERYNSSNTSNFQLSFFTQLECENA
jgi:transposase